MAKLEHLAYDGKKVLVLSVRGSGRYNISGTPILQMGKFSFKIKSNPLVSNVGNHSVGKWDPIPKCDNMRNPWAGLNGKPSFFSAADTQHQRA